MPTIVACVDGSAYSHAVCEFAALFADRIDGEVKLVTVEEGSWMRGAGPAAIQMASDRLSDHGFDRFSAEVAEGSFLNALERVSDNAELIVMGKRGIDQTRALNRLGRHVEPVLRELSTPICLASQLFLPLSRALVVIDSDPGHRQAMDFATSSPFLQEFELELLLMDDGRHSAGPKLADARALLANGRGSAFAMPVNDPNHAMGEHAGGSDLMVMSRQMLFGPAGSDLLPGDEYSFWRRRTPILIC